ncbi:MAG: hypothetical protein HY721_27445 [Planctomycetes bacterium]|nr:hypothetical protein [Planctomycetota bacterium]
MHKTEPGACLFLAAFLLAGLSPAPSLLAGTVHATWMGPATVAEGTRLDLVLALGLEPVEGRRHHIHSGRLIVSGPGGPFFSRDLEDGETALSLNLGMVFADDGILEIAAAGSAVTHWEVYSLFRWRDRFATNDIAIVHEVRVINAPPEITWLTPDLQVSEGEAFDFAVELTDPGAGDTHRADWDLDGDGEHDDFTGTSGRWSFSAPGTHTVSVRVRDDDGGYDTAAFVVTVTESGPGTARFRRGDPSSDGAVDLTDAVVVLAHLFQGAPEATRCERAADANDDGKLDVSDAVSLLLYLFLSGWPPAPPFEACGSDPTPDALGCAAYPWCE